MAIQFAGDTIYLAPDSGDRITDLMWKQAALSFSAWVRVPNTTGLRCFFSANLNNSTSAITLSLLDSTNTFRFAARSQVGDAFNNVVSAGSLSTNTWYNLIGIANFNTGVLNCYVNGTVTTGSPTFGTTRYTPDLTQRDYPTVVGRNVLNSQNFDGAICDLAIFGYQLTSTEISELAAGTRPNDVSGNGPFAYWPMTDGTFGMPRRGGLVLRPVNGNPTIIANPTLDAEPTYDNWERFNDSLRVLYLSAADAASYGTGNPIDNVVIRGSGKSAAASGSARPTYQTVSGASVIRFDGTDDFLEAYIGSVEQQDGISLICIANPSAFTRFISTSDSTTTEFNGYTCSDLSGLVVSGSVLYTATYTDYTRGNLALWSGRWSGVNCQNWLNGVARNPDSTTNTTEMSNGSWYPTSAPTWGKPTLTTLFGKRHNAASPGFGAMDLYGIIIIHGPVTDEEIQYFEGILAWDTGQTSLLPVGHPWKSTEPTISSDIAYRWGTGGEVAVRTYKSKTIYLGTPTQIKTTGDDFLLAFNNFSNTFNTPTVYTNIYKRVGDRWVGISRFQGVWAGLWEHTDGYLYAFYSSRQGGDVIIAKSTNGGVTWTTTTLSNGTLLTAAGSPNYTAPSYNTISQVPLYHDGKIFLNLHNYTGSTPSFEEAAQLVIWCDDDVDLMNAANWTASNQVTIGTTTYTDRTYTAATPGYIEGNLIVDGTGQIYGLYRFVSDDQNKYARIPISWNGTTATMPAWSDSNVVAMPGGQCRFNIAEVGSKYYTITNENTLEAIAASNRQDQRNRVVLISHDTADITSGAWTEEAVLIDEDDVEAYTGFSDVECCQTIGFQYVDILPVGTTLHLTWRLSWSGADDYHDSNFIGTSTLSVSSASSGGGDGLASAIARSIVSSIVSGMTGGFTTSAPPAPVSGIGVMEIGTTFEIG